MPTHLAIRTALCGISGRTRRAAAALAVLVATLVGWAAVGHAATTVDSTATLLWTAPGDDGSSGVASQYDVRYRSVAPTGTDTLTWWNAATKVTGLPHPGVAGVTDSVQVHGLDPSQTWYFVLRTADEVPNWSHYSNIAIRAPYVDHTPPAAITDLTVALAGATTPELPASQKAVPQRRN